MNVRVYAAAVAPTVLSTGASSRSAPSFAARIPLATIGAMALLTVASLAACGKAQTPPGPGGPGGANQAMPVTVIAVQPQRVPIVVEAVGQSEGAKEVQVRARVSGILVKQLYTEGDRVKAGAVLFRIDPAPYRIALAQARAALVQDRARLDLARREEGRLKPLAADQAISGREYDASVTTKKTAEGAVMAREADLKNAELNLSYTNVVATISGVSGRAVNSEGSLVTAGTDSALLTTISQTNPIWVRFSLSESEYATLRRNEANATVRLVMQDGRAYDQPGKLNFAASTVDRTLGTIQLRAEVPNPSLQILPGQFVRTRITVGEENGFLVPQSAVSTSDQGKSVWVAGADGKAMPRPVEVGSWQGSNWIVNKGLEAGDKVIVDNLIKLRPGAPVAPHAPGQAPGGPPPQGQAGGPASAESGKAGPQTKP